MTFPPFAACAPSARTRTRPALFVPVVVCMLVFALFAANSAAWAADAAPAPGVPATPKAAEPAPGAPDYADRANWAYWADELTGGDGIEVTDAVGATAAQTAAKDVDLFIVCPTVSMGEDGSANMDLADADDRASFVGALNMELGIYSGTCRVFAPFYRQATLAMYEASDAELADAIDLAYTDVHAAFEEYLAENPGRPFVLAGFSQGSEHLIRLVEDCLGDEGLQERLVAAYAIGWRLTEEECAAHPWLQAAQGEDDTGVVVSFNSEDPAVESSLVVPAGTKTLSINPLSWTTTGEPASAELNRGACFTDYSGAVVEEVPAFCGAYLDPERGTLKVTGVDPADYPPGLPIFGEGVYHLYDYQFFYRNLQENVAVRVEAYLGRQGKE